VHVAAAHAEVPFCASRSANGVSVLSARSVTLRRARIGTSVRSTGSTEHARQLSGRLWSRASSVAFHLGKEGNA
jgi:hypothetical protein